MMDVQDIKKWVNEPVDTRPDICFGCDRELKLYWQVTPVGLVAVCEDCWDQIMFAINTRDPHPRALLAIWS